MFRSIPGFYLLDRSCGRMSPNIADVLWEPAPPLPDKHWSAETDACSANSGKPHRLVEKGKIGGMVMGLGSALL